MRRLWVRTALALGLGLMTMTSRGEPAPWIAVVVPADEDDALDARSLALVFRRKQTFADDGGRWQPVNLPADHILRRQFSRAVLGVSPEALDDYWNREYFQGVLPPHVLGSEQAVLRFVTTTAHAVGYVAICHQNTDVRTVLVIDPQGELRPSIEAPECPPTR